MHELPFTMSILSIVLEQAKEAQASKISKINLAIGRLSGILPECVQFQFDIINRDTIANGAILSFTQPSAKLRCRNCDINYSTDSLDLTCPNCDEKNIEIISGRECYVDSMEVQ